MKHSLKSTKPQIIVNYDLGEYRKQLCPHGKTKGVNKGGFGDSYRLQKVHSVGFSPEVRDLRGLEYAFKGHRNITASIIYRGEGGGEQNTE